MSLSQIAVFIVGAVLAIVGLFLVINSINPFTWLPVLVGAILVIGGVIILKGGTITV